MRKILIISFIAISLSGFSQRTYFHGAVYDHISEEIMTSVNIRNLTSDLLTSTNEQGQFKIPTKIGDTLKISYVGYKPIFHVVKEDTNGESTRFELIQQIVQLQEVEVNLLPEYWRFKQLVLDTQPMDSTHVVFGLDAIPLDAYEIAANEQKIQPPDYHAPSLAIGFNLGGLTKKGKEKKKLEKLLAQQEMQRTAYRKFNREWVGQETNLKGDELTDFIAYCKFTPEYLVETTLFEIRERMMALLDEFQSEKGGKNNKSYNPGA